MKNNHLHAETSPYLLQHVNNPVDWYPWGKEALERAHQQDKPILLSIGYSACHWCHVMAHESFEDIETADLMNQHFINIKVDKEERPDLDKVYQYLNQLLTHRRGGWPLTVFLTPDTLAPFYSGTYFPSERRFGMPSFKEVLRSCAEVYAKHRKEIQTAGAKIQALMNQTQSLEVVAENKIQGSFLVMAKNLWVTDFDEEEGGFKGAPKFPVPASLMAILLTCFTQPEEALLNKHLLQLVYFTLSKMAAGGIYDHLAGGFFRYSVDERWEIPHFEKMLYDNAQLIGLYAFAYRLTQNEQFKCVVDNCIQWLMNEMHANSGGYYASIDADSNGIEGQYYIWDQKEIQALLGDERYQAIANFYGLDREPNFEHQWHLFQKSPLSTVEQNLLQDVNKKLFQHRSFRKRPATDDKILCMANALLLKGFSLSARLLNQSQYLALAENLYHFIHEKLFYDGKLWVSYKAGNLKQPGFIDDYAFTLDACWYYLQAKWDPNVIAFSKQIADKLIADFWDEEHGGFYFTPHQHEKLVYRPKIWTDDAIPAGNIVAALALLRFGYLLNNPQYFSIAEKTLKVAQSIIVENPQDFPSVMLLQSEYLSPPTMIIVYGQTALISEAQPPLWSNALHTVFTISCEEALPAELKQYGSQDPLSIYICEGLSCQAPLKSLDELKAWLAERLSDGIHGYRA